MEQNRDGQMADLVRLERPADAARVRSVRHYTGMPLDAGTVTRGILAHERPATAVVAEGAIR